MVKACQPLGLVNGWCGHYLLTHTPFCRPGALSPLKNTIQHQTGPSAKHSLGTLTVLSHSLSVSMLVTELVQRSDSIQ